MLETWSYEREKRFDKAGRRWHFVRRNFYDEDTPYEDTPYELYFRDDEKTEFGLLRFERNKDNPYRDHESIVKKIISNGPFRNTLLNPETADVWKKNWT